MAKPQADRFSPDPWEQRVAELEHSIVEKNRRILQLEDDLNRRDTRLREAVARLNEAEDAIEVQARLVMLATGEGGGEPDALARVSAEKGVLETRERQLRSERDRMIAERNQREAQVQALKHSVQQAKLALDARDRRIVELESRNRAMQSAANTAATEFEAKSTALREAQRASEERGRTFEANTTRLERQLSEAEHQLELYRKNLVRAEEDMTARDEELVVASEEQNRLQTEVRRQERQGAFVERQRDRLQERLKEEANHSDERYLQQARRAASTAHEAGTRQVHLLHAKQRQHALEIELRSTLHLHAGTLRELVEANIHADHGAADLAATRGVMRELESAAMAARVYASRAVLLALTHATQSLREHGISTAPAFRASLPAAESSSAVATLMRWLRRRQA